MEWLAGDKQTDHYSDFVSSGGESLKRMIRFGKYGGLIEFDSAKKELVTENIVAAPHKLQSDPDKSECFAQDFQLSSDKGQLISIRMKIRPFRGHSNSTKWKCAFIVKDDSNKKYFAFHSGLHNGLEGWAVYPTPVNYKTTFFVYHTKLDFDQDHELQVWFNNNREIACVGIDSSKNRLVFPQKNLNKEEFWHPPHIENATKVVIELWGDESPASVYIQHLELDYLKQTNKSQ